MPRYPKRNRSKIKPIGMDDYCYFDDSDVFNVTSHSEAPSIDEEQFNDAETASEVNSDPDASGSSPRYNFRRNDSSVNVDSDVYILSSAEIEIEDNEIEGDAIDNGISKSVENPPKPPTSRKKRKFFYTESDSATSILSSDSDSDSKQIHDEQHRLKKQRAKIRSLNAINANLDGDNQPSRADVQPLAIDRSVDWNSVGGLKSHIKSLQEMVMFPLLYPELFTKFGVSPPRGVLFFGPPGTGKTLVARALANTCSTDGRKVSFFMRKGADCLSKWIGEAERQLRLLFEEAHANQPSIIFFDEIDGLAPVRSSRQDQVHSSIVSTLLALMDGIDSRGQVIIIGATNRIDSIDPALRRPGRFDRELCFPLPCIAARASILKIHTSKWDPPLTDAFVQEIAELSAGFCGADIKALCTEAALIALRRRYPQIYHSTKKLQIDPSSVVIERSDFMDAHSRITPAAMRSSRSFARPIPTHLQPLLHSCLDIITQRCAKVFPLGCKTKSSTVFSDVIEEPTSSLIPMKPRMIIHGNPALGQSLFAAALLQSLEDYPVYSLDMPSLFSDVSSRIPEEACVHAFREAVLHAPSIMFCPHFDLWWDVASDQLRACFFMCLTDIPVNVPVFFLSTANTPLDKLPEHIRSLFKNEGESIELSNPINFDRLAFFRQAVAGISDPPIVESPNVVDLPELPVAVEHKENAIPLPTQKIQDDTFRALRMFLRTVCTRLITHFPDFAEPVEIQQYFDTISQPICLQDIRHRVNNCYYLTIEDFLVDIDLLVSNTKEYFGDERSVGRNFINKACHLQDNTLSMVLSFDRRLASRCEEIAQYLQQAQNQAAKEEEEEEEEEEKEEADNHVEEPIDGDNNNNDGDDDDDDDVRYSEKEDSGSPVKVKYDEATLGAIVTIFVQKTFDYDVEQLEHLYFQISALVSSHRDSLDKEKLLRELDEFANMIDKD